MRIFDKNRAEGSELGVELGSNAFIQPKTRFISEYSLYLNTQNAPAARPNTPNYPQRGEVINVVLDLITPDSEVIWSLRPKVDRLRFSLSSHTMALIESCEEYYKFAPGGVNNAVRWRFFGPIGLRVDLNRRPVSWVPSLIKDY